MAAPDPPHKKICPGSCARNRSSLFIQDKQNKAYACSTLLARRHFVQTFILLTPPSAFTLTLWTLEFQILLDLLCEWLTLFPKCAPLPQTSHFAIMTPPHVSKFRRQHTYTTRDILQMQEQFFIFYSILSHFPETRFRKGDVPEAAGSAVSCGSPLP